MANLELAREINAPVERVFQAWSDPAQMQQWFFPNEDMSCTVTADFRVGGNYEVLMHSAAKDKTFKHFGTYEAIEPNRRIVFTWNSPFVENTRVTLSFAPVGKGTQLQLHHEFFEDDAIKQQHNDGWHGCLQQLTNHLNATVAA